MMHSPPILCRAFLASIVLISTSCRRERVGLEEPAFQSVFEIIQTTPPAGVVAAADIYPLSPGSRTFLSLDEDGGVIGEVVYERTPTEQYGAVIRASERPDRVQFWRKNEAGDIVMTAVIEHADNVVSHFDPPIAIAFPQQPAGKTLPSEAAMRVMSLPDEKRERESGRAERTITYIDNQRVRTPAGEFDAQRVEIRFIADLRIAHADKRTILWCVPDLGVIAEQTSEDVTVMGMLARQSQERLVIAATPEP